MYSNVPLPESSQCFPRLQFGEGGRPI